MIKKLKIIYIIEDGQQGQFQQLLYSNWMEVQKSSYDQLRKVLIDDDMSEEFEKQQLSQVYKEIKQELVRFKPESLAIFQQWVTRIYKFKVKVTDLGLETKNIQFSISSGQIEKIINRVLVEACGMHKQLIEEELRLVREQAEQYYKIDAQEPEVGYFDHLRDLVTTNEGTKTTEAKFCSSCPNQQFYSYCVWIIYNHYCSLSQCNDIVCELAKIFHQTSENLIYRIFKQIDKKKLQNNQDTDQLSRTVDNCHEIRHIVSMVQDQQVIKVNELNILTIANLIPSSMSIISNLNNDSNQNSTSKQEQSILYWHICSFQTTINSIIYENKQNMRRYVVYLRNFKRAIKILKDRLGKSGNLHSNNENTELKKTRKERSRKKFSFNEESLLSSQIQKNIDLFRCLDEQFILQNEKTKSDQAQLVKNLEQSLGKEKNFMKISKPIKLPQFNTNQFKIPKQQEANQNIKNVPSLKKQSSFSMKNQTIFESSENNFESITRISAMKSQKMNIERYKLQVILKKNEKNNEKTNKNGITNNFHEQFLEKRRKIDSQLSQHLHKQIVSQLKNSLNNYMKNPLSKEQQLANYLKITQKHGKKKIIGFDDQPEHYEPNLHQFIQNGDFRNDQQSQGDENYLQKISEQNNEGQKKKKKKKNKKKKNKKNENGLDQALNTNDSVVEVSNVKTKPNLKNEVGAKQYEIIKVLESIKVDLENRYKCFEIHDDCLKNMQKRQTDLLERQVNRSEIGSPKSVVKNKKQKVK